MASVISTGLHAAMLVFAAVSFSGKEMNATPVESLPVDLISDKEFSEITKGQKDAPKPAEAPKPLVEKIAPEVKPVEESKPKVVENKPEVQATQSKSAPPPPEPEQKQAEKKDSKPTPQQPAPVAMDKTDPIADKLKQAKDEPKPLPPKKPPQKQDPKFDANQIAALIDQREPQRHAVAGDTLNKEAALGRANATGAKLSEGEIAAFVRRMRECWDVPAGVQGGENVSVELLISFNPDGSLKRAPQTVGGSPHVAGPVFAESARRALLKCQPYTMFRKETYNGWKEIQATFRMDDFLR